VSVGDGRETAFWHDNWLLDGPLAELMPALYSHYTGRVVSVHDVVSTGLRALLQRRLTTQASEELAQLENLLLGVNLSENPDQRSSFFEGIDHRLRSGLIYKSSTRGDHASPSFEFVWRNFAPPRVKFFGWLLTQNRIHSRTSLVRKNILDDARCEVCGAEDETADHVFSGCTFVQTFWSRIGWAPGGIPPVTELWNSQTPPRVHKSVAHPLILLYCWEIWRHRNDVVFRHMAPSIDCLVAASKEAARSWSCRIPNKNEALKRNWSSIVDM